MIPNTHLLLTGDEAVRTISLRILKWNGTDWTAQSSGTILDLKGVWGADANNVWAVGAGGTILRWNGMSWAGQTSSSVLDLRGVWGADVNNIWAVAQTLLGGTILKWNGAAWTLQLGSPTNNLNAVWGADVSHVWTFGALGTILH